MSDLGVNVSDATQLHEFGKGHANHPPEILNQWVDQALQIPSARLLLLYILKNHPNLNNHDLNTIRELIDAKIRDIYQRTNPGKG